MPKSTTVSRSLWWSSLALAALGASCTLGPGAEHRIVGREISAMTSDPHAYRVAAGLGQLLEAKADDSVILQQAIELVRTNQPGLIATAAIQLGNWADVDSRRVLLRSVAEACVASSDPMIRWSGIYLFAKSGSPSRACDELRANWQTLRLRPEFGKHEGSYVDWASPAVAVASIRADLLNLLPMCDIPWQPVLAAIANDPDEWHDPTVEVARKVLSSQSQKGD